MSKRALITIAIGDDPAYRYGLMSIQHYAEQIGCEFIVVDREIIESPSHFSLQQRAWLQKIAVINMSEKFEEILYLDSDVLVHPDAPDFFSWIEKESPESFIAMYDELHLGQREGYIEKLYSLGDFKSSRLPSVDAYFNVGVMYLKTGHRIGSLISLSDVVSTIDAGIPCPEQTYLNYVLAIHRSPVFSLPRAFNFMQEDIEDVDRMNQFFIHYAGYSFRSNKSEKRSKIMREDFACFFARAESNVRPSFTWKFIDGFLDLKFSIAKKIQRAHLRFRNVCK